MPTQELDYLYVSLQSVFQKISLEYELNEHNALPVQSIGRSISELAIV